MGTRKITTSELDQKKQTTGVNKAPDGTKHPLGNFLGGRPGGPLRLLPKFVCNDTVETLEDLLKYAREGGIVGMAFVVWLPGLRYIVDTAGWATRDPTASRGAVAFLDDRLRALVEDQASADDD